MENLNLSDYIVQNDYKGRILNPNLKIRSTINASLKILHPKAVIPSAATDGSAGYDLCALIENDSFIVIEPKQTVLVRTGLSIFLDDPNFVGLVHPRSGLGHRHGIVLGNLTGVIDSDYQGELFVSLWNRSDKPYTVNHGDRIAQLVVVPRFDVQFKVVSEFELSGRNSGGFGHTGK